LKAVVMAGGEGSRLRPLTCQLPKPMVPVMNRPLMEYALDLLYYHGINNVAATLQYLPEQIREHFGDGSGFNMSMRYYVEEEPLGTAGSVKNAAAFLDETFVVVSGDALTDIDLTAAMEFHRKRGAMATLVLTPVDNPLEFGLVITDSHGRITRFVEKPGWGEVFSDTVNTGIYILEPEVLNYVEKNCLVDFSKDVFPRLLEKGEPLFGCVIPGYWCDVGNIEQYSRAHRDALFGKVKLSLKGQETEKGVWMEKGVEVHPRSSLYAPVYLGEGTYLGPGTEVKETVLGPRNWLEALSSVKRGVTWKGVCLEKKCNVRGAVIGSSVRLASRSAVYEGTVIGDGSLVEEKAVVKPDVKVWPEKKVESGTILSESLIWGTRGLKELFGLEGIKGEANREITPEMAAKLGAAFANVIKGGTVLLSSDNCSVCRMLKGALASGLLSAGMDVYLLEESAAPVTRRALLEMEAHGGVHLRQIQEDPPSVLIKFLDEKAMNISRGQERKIEQYFFRGDFYRSPATELGEERKIPDYSPGYLKELGSNIKRETVRRAGFRIVLGYPNSLMQRVVQPLLGKLGCRMVTLQNNDLETGSFKELRKQRREVAQAVKQHAAHLGVILDPDGEQMLLIDERGCIVEEGTYMALLSLLIFRAGRGQTVAIPVNAPGVIEELANRYQGRVLRTRTAPRFRMEEMYREEGHSTEGMTPFSLSFDCLAALAYLLEFMAVEDVSLSHLLAEIPEIQLRQKEIPCPWDKKGMIMRKLIEDAPQEKIEMVDGLKVHHPEGWALVLPDAERPAYHVYGEGFNEEVSSSLTDFYARKITSLQKET